MARILVVEDNVDFAFGLRINLEQDGHEATAVHSGSQALAHGRAEVDLVLLDLGLPDLHGLEVLQHIRSHGPQIPVIVLSAVADEEIRVEAFRRGADDYVTKPFSLPELLERVKARLRVERSRERATSGLIVDVRRHQVTCEGNPIRLTPKEFELLCVLVRCGETVVSYDWLIEAVWCLPQGWRTRTAVTHVGTLRRKLSAAGYGHAIRTVPKRGIAWTLGDCMV